MRMDILLGLPGIRGLAPSCDEGRPRRHFTRREEHSMPTQAHSPSSLDHQAQGPDDGSLLEREVEQEALRLVSAPSRKPVTLIFLGPRGTGKSCLARRVDRVATQTGRIVCSIDVTADFEPSQRTQRGAFFTRLSELLVYRLTGAKVEHPPDVMGALETAVFPRHPERTPFTVILDDIDAIFLESHAVEVYRLLRNLHEQGRTSSGPYSEIDWIFTSTLELDVLNTLFDINVESPFNIGAVFRLSDLSLDEVFELGRSHPGWTEAHLEQLHELLGGHPELTKQALTMGINVLRKPKADFKRHLEDVRKSLDDDRQARKALERLQKGENIQLHGFAKVKQDYQRVVFALSAAGVIRPKGVGFVIRNRLYREGL
jgi:hypothetical protein